MANRGEDAVTVGQRVSVGLLFFIPFGNNFLTQEVFSSTFISFFFIQVLLKWAKHTLFFFTGEKTEEA